MDKVKQLNVYCHEKKVGTLALYKEHYAAFEYDGGWLESGFSISPFSLPLKRGVFIPKMEPFDGIFGVFADSLPDGWGRLLVDRLMLKNHIPPVSAGNLDRLAIVGDSGMGALTYRPEMLLVETVPELDLDRLAAECEKILKTDYSEDLDKLFSLGGSSGGARPKILTNIGGGEWIIKFPSHVDKKDIGKQEYEYSVCAKKCGIDMADTRLFPSNECAGYFGTKRFDRTGTRRVHMVSVSALLETSHRIPNLDYNILMRLTLEITGDFEEVLKLYRLMCFNVYAHNRDDHSKNFSYIYDEDEGRWRLSPAYDLTYSSSIGGEHATTVNGNGTNPALADMLAVAESVDIPEKKARQIASDVRECVYYMLSEYLQEYGN